MIIYLIFLLAIVVILSWTLINNRTWRWLIGLTSSIALVAAVSIMTFKYLRRIMIVNRLGSVLIKPVLAGRYQSQNQPSRGCSHR